jgi:hypothetical protein
MTKILSISPGTGWSSRWKHIGIDDKYMHLEVAVFAVVGNSNETRLTSFSGPTNSFTRPDDEHDPFNHLEFPWQFVGWIKTQGNNQPFKQSNPYPTNIKAILDQVEHEESA